MMRFEVVDYPTKRLGQAWNLTTELRLITSERHWSQSQIFGHLLAHIRCSQDFSSSEILTSHDLESLNHPLSLLGVWRPSRTHQISEDDGWISDCDRDHMISLIIGKNLLFRVESYEYYSAHRKKLLPQPQLEVWQLIKEVQSLYSLDSQN